MNGGEQALKEHIKTKDKDHKLRRGAVLSQKFIDFLGTYECKFNQYNF